MARRGPADAVLFPEDRREGLLAHSLETVVYLARN
jgi:hypothetical protein